MDAINSKPTPYIEDGEHDSLTVLEPTAVHGWSLELTSRCNLRCTYCSVPHWPGYGAADMGIENISKILSLLKDGRISQLSLSGRGEITYIEGWTELVELFLNTGIPLHTVTNLASPLSWQEAETLARFNNLSISIDSADREQMKVARKGADLRNILYNISLIKAAAVNFGREKMPFSILSVVNKSNALMIRNLAALAVSLGASRLSLQDLVMDYSPDVDTIDVSHVSHLNADEVKEFAQQFQDARALCSQHNIGFSTFPSIMAIVEQALNGDDPTGHGIEEVSVTGSTVGNYLRHAKPQGDGETRFCLMPWTMGIFMVDGGVEPCCGSFGSVGSYMDAETLHDVVNIPEIVQLRKQLLSGDIPDVCKYCCSTPTIKIEDFKKEVEKCLSQN